MWQFKLTKIIVCSLMQTGISESVVSATRTIGFVIGVGYILHLIYTEINKYINIWIVDIHIHSL